jgi:hypothetical protein
MNEIPALPYEGETNPSRRGNLVLAVVAWWDAGQAIMVSTTLTAESVGTTLFK